MLYYKCTNFINSFCSFYFITKSKKICFLIDIYYSIFSMISMQAISFILTRHTENYFHIQTYPDRQTNRQTDTYTHVWKRSALRSEFDNYLPNVLPIYNNLPPFLYLPPFPSYFFLFFSYFPLIWMHGPIWSVFTLPPKF